MPRRKANVYAESVVLRWARKRSLLPRPRKGCLVGRPCAYNFYLGAYFQQGFTKNRRTIFFDQPDIPVSTDLMFDGQIGFRFGWLIPVYKRQPKSYYFN